MNRWRVTLPPNQCDSPDDHWDFTSFSKAKAWMRMFPPSWEFTIERIPEKPPFDPLKQGWMPCPVCRDYGPADTCTTCDGLGIVVGPPSDGIRVAPFRRSPRWPEIVAAFSRLH